MNVFSEEELIAIYYAAHEMVLADGKVMPEEVVTIEEAMTKAGVKSIAELGEIKKKSSLLSKDECYDILAFMNPEQKKFVSSMLGAISSSDGDIDDRELEYWRRMCDVCNLPIMNNRQAIIIFKSF